MSAKIYGYRFLALFRETFPSSSNKKSRRNRNGTRWLMCTEFYFLKSCSSLSSDVPRKDPRKRRRFIWKSTSGEIVRHVCWSTRGRASRGAVAMSEKSGARRRARYPFRYVTFKLLVGTLGERGECFSTGYGWRDKTRRLTRDTTN